MVPSKLRVLLPGDFKAWIGKNNDVDNVIFISGKHSCNSNGNVLIDLLHKCD